MSSSGLRKDKSTENSAFFKKKKRKVLAGVNLSAQCPSTFMSVNSRPLKMVEKKESRPTMTL